MRERSGDGRRNRRPPGARRRILAVLVAALGLAASAAEKPCDWCHLNADGGPLQLAGDWLCIECHEERLARGEHLVGVPNYGPTTLPLYGGVIACTTCHDPHSTAVSALRVPAAQLCNECHDR